jgi:hypothetical protein
VRNDDCEYRRAGVDWADCLVVLVFREINNNSPQRREGRKVKDSDLISVIP